MMSRLQDKLASDSPPGAEAMAATLKAVFADRAERIHISGNFVNDLATKILYETAPSVRFHLSRYKIADDLASEDFKKKLYDLQYDVANIINTPAQVFSDLMNFYEFMTYQYLISSQVELPYHEDDLTGEVLNYLVLSFNDFPYETQRHIAKGIVSTISEQLGVRRTKKPVQEPETLSSALKERENTPGLAEKSHFLDKKQSLLYDERVDEQEKALAQAIKSIYKLDDEKAGAISAGLHASLTAQFAKISQQETPTSLPAEGAIVKWKDHLAANPYAPRDPGQYYLDHWKRYEAVGLTQAELRRRDMPLVNAIRYQKGDEALNFLPPKISAITAEKAAAGDRHAIVRQYKTDKQREWRQRHREPKN